VEELVKSNRIWKTGAALAVLGLAIQLVPYRPGANPPVLGEPAWDSPRTRELFYRSCKNCHSQETEWPWYASVAPSAWLVRWDVDEARSHFNVSAWGHAKNKHADEAASAVRDDWMPPWYYRPLHPEGRLSEPERQELAAGLAGTFGDAEAHPEHEHEAAR
jgi:mono/diheme cytochrome c family protein